MDRLQAMEVFVRVAETGSFSAAARGFAVTQSTATKQVALLAWEDRGEKPTPASVLLLC